MIELHHSIELTHKMVNRPPPTMMSFYTTTLYFLRQETTKTFRPVSSITDLQFIDLHNQFVYRFLLLDLFRARLISMHDLEIASSP